MRQINCNSILDLRFLLTMALVFTFHIFDGTVLDPDRTLHTSFPSIGLNSSHVKCPSGPWQWMSVRREVDRFFFFFLSRDRKVSTLSVFKQIRYENCTILCSCLLFCFSEIIKSYNYSNWFVLYRIHEVHIKF